MRWFVLAMLLAGCSQAVAPRDFSQGTTGSRHVFDFDPEGWTFTLEPPAAAATSFDGEGNPLDPHGNSGRFGPGVVRMDICSSEPATDYVLHLLPPG